MEFILHKALGLRRGDPTTEIGIYETGFREIYFKSYYSKNSLLFAFKASFLIHSIGIRRFRFFDRFRSGDCSSCDVSGFGDLSYKKTNATSRSRRIKKAGAVQNYTGKTTDRISLCVQWRGFLTSPAVKRTD